MTAPGRGGGSELDATVLICTYNRAAYLAATLDSLATARVPPDVSWDVLVVDNNSSDATREIVNGRIRSFPVRLRYLFEARQGKSHALNTGMAATPARIIVFTDDDVRVPESWLAAAVRPLLEDDTIDYTGGPVRPIWGAACPSWLDPAGNLGGTIAVKDHGATAFIFEEHRKTPLGVNMAVRRRLIERIGGFSPAFGRSKQSLLGQEQAEFFYRSRRAGSRGRYVPEMVIDHVVPAARLTRRYFLRWAYWKGVAHARLHRLYGETEIGLQLAAVPTCCGVPRFIVGSAARHLWGWLRAAATGDASAGVEHATGFAYAAGYCREWRAGSARHVACAAKSMNSPT
jgi:glycosyltransferase involved in cell wall biosynthesis